MTNQEKKEQLMTIVQTLDIHTTMILQGVLLEHAMKLVGMTKKQKKSVIEL